MRFTTWLSLVLLFVLGLSACSKPEATDQAPAGSTITITSISPATTNQLVVGKKVNLKVTVAYWLAADSGTLGFVVQSADTTSLAQDEFVVQRGGGEKTFQVEVVIPDTKSLSVFTPLSAVGQNATSTLDTRAYSVAKE